MRSATVLCVCLVLLSGIIIGRVDANGRVDRVASALRNKTKLKPNSAAATADAPTTSHSTKPDEHAKMLLRKAEAYLADYHELVVKDVPTEQLNAISDSSIGHELDTASKDGYSRLWCMADSANGVVSADLSTFICGETTKYAQLAQEDVDHSTEFYEEKLKEDASGEEITPVKRGGSNDDDNEDSDETQVDVSAVKHGSRYMRSTHGSIYARERRTGNDGRRPLAEKAAAVVVAKSVKSAHAASKTASKTTFKTTSKTTPTSKARPSEKDETNQFLHSNEAAHLARQIAPSLVTTGTDSRLVVIVTKSARASSTKFQPPSDAAKDLLDTTKIATPLSLLDQVEVCVISSLSRGIQWQMGELSADECVHSEILPANRLSCSDTACVFLADVMEIHERATENDSTFLGTSYFLFRLSQRNGVGEKAIAATANPPVSQIPMTSSSVIVVDSSVSPTSQCYVTNGVVECQRYCRWVGFVWTCSLANDYTSVASESSLFGTIFISVFLALFVVLLICTLTYNDKAVVAKSVTTVQYH